MKRPSLLDSGGNNGASQYISSPQHSPTRRRRRKSPAKALIVAGLFIVGLFIGVSRYAGHNKQYEDDDVEEPTETERKMAEGDINAKIDTNNKLDNSKLDDIKNVLTEAKKERRIPARWAPDEGNITYAKEPAMPHKAVGPQDLPWTQLRHLHSLSLTHPRALVLLLEEDDPFSVYSDEPETFPCPPHEYRFSLPDTRSQTSAAAFRNGAGFIYFQHLRKAGGTAFCDMATRNMGKTQVPPYYCMPDQRGSLATPPMNEKKFFLDKMKKNKWRIAANEWDAFPKSHFNLPGAVFVTVMRHPVDRWYSQYRFEHIEHRDTKRVDPLPTLRFHRWYKLAALGLSGDNYYTKTFSGELNNPEDLKNLDKKGEIRYKNDLIWTYNKFKSWGSHVMWENFRDALTNLLKFNIILITELLDTAAPLIEKELGWKQPPKQVLPHERVAMRKDHKSREARASLDHEEFMSCAQANAADMLLYHWARRIYLERYACSNFKTEQ